MEDEHNISLLVEWFEAQCNGIWEHEHSVIRLVTLDNPGFSISIDLNGTRWAKSIFEEIFENIESENCWLHCRKGDDAFWKASCAPSLLGRAIGYFIDWTKIQPND